MSSDKLPQDLLQQVHTLLEKLEDYDSEAENVLSEILNKVDGTPIYDLLLGVKKKIGQYDLEEAAEELKTLIEQIGQIGKDSV